MSSVIPSEPHFSRTSQKLDPAIAGYRGRAQADGLASFRVAIKESDVAVACDRPLRDEALAALAFHRSVLEAYIAEQPGFLRALSPVPVHPRAPRVVARMARAALSAGVGPMAAVAGALADEVGWALLAGSTEVIVENGGDIYCRVARPRIISIAAGRSPLSHRIGIKIFPEMGGVGVCTSSGTCGSSLSFGRADAACVIARTAALADAAATAVGNVINEPSSIEFGLALALAIPSVFGAVIILGGHIGARGAIELTEIG